MPRYFYLITKRASLTSGPGLYLSPKIFESREEAEQDGRSYAEEHFPGYESVSVRSIWEEGDPERYDESWIESTVQDGDEDDDPEGTARRRTDTITLRICMAIFTTLIAIFDSPESHIAWVMAILCWYSVFRVFMTQTTRQELG